MVSKVEVIAKTERKRRFDDDEKRRIVEEANVPGASVAEVCRRHALAPSVFYCWRASTYVA